MKRYILALLMLISLHSAGQSFESKTAEFRKKYMADFLEDSSSPLKKDDLQYLRFYDADSTYAVQAKVELQANASPFIIPRYGSSAGSQYVKYAVLKMTIKGQPVKLAVYRNLALAKIPAYADYLFLPFTDETNGKETYGGGRYIDLREGDFKGNTVTIDFNKAYNPYCAFSAGYACPKPPDENQLHMAIKAGEKRYAKAH